MDAFGFGFVAKKISAASTTSIILLLFVAFESRLLMMNTRKRISSFNWLTGLSNYISGSLELIPIVGDEDICLFSTAGLTLIGRVGLDSIGKSGKRGSMCGVEFVFFGAAAGSVGGMVGGFDLGCGGAEVTCFSAST